MNIPIPRLLVRSWARFGDWGDHTIWQLGRIEVLRIDLLLVVAFAIAIGYYGYYGGMNGAINGGVLFILMTALAVLFRR
jgi:hypothetical protein